MHSATECFVKHHQICHTDVLFFLFIHITNKYLQHQPIHEFKSQTIAAPSFCLLEV